jgi:hypothetical protein
MSAVRPEFGPTLPELAGPRLRALPRGARIALAVAVALLLAVIAWALFIRSGERRDVLVRGPITFNFQYDPPVRQRPVHAGELARVGRGRESMAVRPIALPAYRGASSGFLPVYAVTLERQMAPRFPGFEVIYEGRANVNRKAGYELGFRYRDGARTMFGRRIVLLPTETARRGLDLLLLSPKSSRVGRPEGVGRNDHLRVPLFTFALGDQKADVKVQNQ